MKLKIKKLSPDATIPTYGTEESAGFDLYASEGKCIFPGGRTLVSTGIALDIPKGFEVQVRPRSGLAIKSGITVLNAPGTIDSDYTGEVKVMLINLSTETYYLLKGDRIAQGILSMVADQVTFEEVEDITKDTTRGSGGFGSTGSGLTLSNTRDENGFIQSKGVVL